MQTVLIPGVILAGGLGLRLGMGTKPLVALAGQPLIAHVIKAVAPQFKPLAIAVRTPTSWSEKLGFEIISDTTPDAGPLAGVAAAMLWATITSPNAQTVLTCTADCPFIPADLAARLVGALTDDTEIVIASSQGQRHHLIALWRISVHDRLTATLQKPGTLPVHQFQSQCRVRVVEWQATPLDPFFNINTPEDLTAAEGICSTADERKPTSS